MYIYFRDKALYVTNVFTMYAFYGQDDNIPAMKEAHHTTSLNTFVYREIAATIINVQGEYKTGIHSASL